MTFLHPHLLWLLLLLPVLLLIYTSSTESVVVCECTYVTRSLR